MTNLKIVLPNTTYEKELSKIESEISPSKIKVLNNLPIFISLLQ